MKNMTAYMAAAALAIGGAAMVGCEKDETTTKTTTPDGTTVTVKTDVDRPATQDVGDKMKDSARTAGDTIGDAAGTAKDKLSNAADTAGDKMSAAADKTGDALKNAKNKAGEIVKGHGTDAAPDAEDIRNVLADAVEASVKKGTFSDLVERLVDADRNRIGSLSDADKSTLDGRATQFLADWKAKYGENFDVPHNTVFTEQFAMIQQTEAPKGGAVNVNVGGGDAGVKVTTPGGQTNTVDENRNEPGRNLATVNIAASHGMPALSIPMVHELPDSWRIDVKDSITGTALRDNVLKHLSMVSDDKANWPADKTEAYRVVSHHILMGVLGM